MSQTDPAELSHGDVVDYNYRDEDGDQKSGTGTVCKSNKGGIRILPHSEKTPQYIHKINNGRVSRTHRDGGAGRFSQTIGAGATVTPTGEQRAIEYVDQTGWVHPEGEEE